MKIYIFFLRTFLPKFLDMSPKQLKRKALKQRSQSDEEYDEDEQIMETEKELDEESQCLKRAKQDKIIQKVSQQIKNNQLSLTIFPKSFIWFNIGDPIELILQVKSYLESSSLTQQLSSCQPSSLNVDDIYLKLIEKHPKELQLNDFQPQLTVKLKGHQLHSLMRMMMIEKSGGGTGFLCDDTGMGKTLTVLGLIVSNPSKEHCIDGDKVYQQTQFQLRNPEMDNTTKQKLKCTLMVVPIRIIEQWTIEISKYAPQLKVLVFDNIFTKSLQSNILHDRKYAYHRLVEADIVIVSSCANHGSYTKNGRYYSLLYTFYVHRICLDEGHQRGFNCSQIMAQCKWIITATPFSEKNKKKINMKDIYWLVERIESYLSRIHDEGYKYNIFSINGEQNFHLQNLLFYFHRRNRIKYPTNMKDPLVGLLIISLRKMFIIHKKDQLTDKIVVKEDIHIVAKMTQSEKNFSSIFDHPTFKNQPSIKVEVFPKQIILRERCQQFLKDINISNEICDSNPFTKNFKIDLLLNELQEREENSGGLVNSIVYTSHCLKLHFLKDFLTSKGFKVYYFNSDVSIAVSNKMISGFQSINGDFESFKSFLSGTFSYDSSKKILRNGSSHAWCLGGVHYKKIASYLFQSAVFIMTPFSGSSGLNLQTASQVYTLEDIPKAVKEQTFGHVYRMGQTKSVSFTFIVGDKESETYDKKLWQYIPPKWIEGK